MERGEGEEMGGSREAHGVRGEPVPNADRRGPILPARAPGQCDILELEGRDGLGERGAGGDHEGGPVHVRADDVGQAGEGDERQEADPIYDEQSECGTEA